MTFIIQQTLLYAVPLMIVALPVYSPSAAASSTWLWKAS